MVELGLAQGFPCELNHSWNLSIANGADSVHIIGHIITISANDGLRYVGSVSQVLNPSDILAPRKCGEPMYRFRLLPLNSFFPIVGTMSLTACDSRICDSVPSGFRHLGSPDFVILKFSGGVLPGVSVRVGVGTKNEDAFSQMHAADFTA